MAADLTILRDLRERVQKASGADRDLDQRIFALDYGWTYPLHGASRQEFDQAPFQGVGTNYTDSLDATLALVERTLPPIPAFTKGSPPSSGWKMGFYRGMTPTGEKHAFWEAWIRRHGEDGVECTAPTPALALLSALLSALIAQQENAHVG